MEEVRLTSRPNVTHHWRLLKKSYTFFCLGLSHSDKFIFLEMFSNVYIRRNRVFVCLGAAVFVGGEYTCLLYTSMFLFSKNVFRDQAVFLIFVYSYIANSHITVTLLTSFSCKGKFLMFFNFECRPMSSERGEEMKCVRWRGDEECVKFFCWPGFY